MVLDQAGAARHQDDVAVPHLFEFRPRYHDRARRQRRLPIALSAVLVVVLRRNDVPRPTFDEVLRRCASSFPKCAEVSADPGRKRNRDQGPGPLMG